MAPAITNTHIRICLTVEFNRVSSFSGLKCPTTPLATVSDPAAGRKKRTAAHNS